MKRSEIEQLLPGIFRRTVRDGEPIAALLDVMEALHRPAEDVLRRLDAAFNPRRTREDLCLYLARWVDLGHILPITSGSGGLRELVSCAAKLAQWRGTARGLILFLETATGVDGFKIAEQVEGPDGLPLPFHIRVSAPASSAAHRTMIVRIIESEKPAYVTYDLEFRAAASEGG